MQIGRAASVTLSANFSRGNCDELLDSLEHKSDVLPLWRTPVLLTGSIRWGDGTHFKDKHEKHPDKTDNNSVSRYRKPDTVSSLFLFCLLLPSGKSYSTFQCLQFSLFILLFCSTAQNFLIDADVLSFLFLSEPLKLYNKPHQGCKTSTLSSS